MHEVAKTVVPYIAKHPKLPESIVLERITEPDRIYVFRVLWEDDEGHIRVNRSYQSAPVAVAGVRRRFWRRRAADKPVRGMGRRELVLRAQQPAIFHLV